MSTRSRRAPIAIAVAAALGLSLVGSAVAHEEASPAPDAVAERQAEREAARAERRAARDERKAEQVTTRAARKAERAAVRDERKAERRALRAGLKAAWSAVRDECRAELQSIREDPELDRPARRQALTRARRACRESLAAARDEYRAGASRGAGASALDDLYSVAAADGTGVVRTDLGLAEPGSAPGEELGLWHYRIPARTDLVPHTHPGWQLARVTGGELEYTVIEGEGVLLRGDESGPMGPGAYVLATGDGVIENPDLIHQASNRTDEPVTIISATLYPAGADLSTLVEVEPMEEAGAGE